MYEKTLELFLKTGLAVILRNVPEDKLMPVAQALVDGGIRLMEVTYSPDGSVPDEAIASRIAMLADRFAGAAVIGGGTVLKPSQVTLTADAGGGFIVSPNTDEAVIAQTRRLGLVSVPGALTPSEAVRAHQYGADLIKLFPVTALGADYMKVVFSPLKHLRFVAVGQITLSDLAPYREAGACGFAVGSHIADPERIAVGDYAAITENARRFVAALTPCS